MRSRYKEREKKRRRARREQKKNFFKKLLLFLLILIIILIVWGRFGEINILTIHDYKVTNEKLPSSFEGFRIVHFSDMHYGTGYNEYRLENLINKINDLDPDIVVFTGDLIDKDYEADDNDLKLITSYLNKIDSKLGKYAIFGNHDFNNDKYENVIYDSGFTLLKNNYDTIYNESNVPIAIYGFDDVLLGDPKADNLNDKTINDITYKIVLVHEPDYVDEFINDSDVSLVLSGHSHNGQVKLPFIRPIFLPEGSKKYYGSYYDVNGIPIYISNGIGNSIFDFRLFSTPSINIYRLYTK